MEKKGGQIMVNIEESEIFGKLLNTLEEIIKQIDSKEIRDKIQNIINEMDKVVM